jgi:excisionase family DNA binding protein
MPSSTSTTIPQPLTVTAAGAARMLGIGKYKTLTLIHSGRLPAVQLDTRIRVKVTDIEVFLAGLPPVPVPSA